MGQQQTGRLTSRDHCVLLNLVQRVLVDGVAQLVCKHLHTHTRTHARISRISRISRMRATPFWRARVWKASERANQRHSQVSLARRYGLARESLAPLPPRDAGCSALAALPLMPSGCRFLVFILSISRQHPASLYTNLRRVLRQNAHKCELGVVHACHFCLLTTVVDRPRVCHDLGVDKRWFGLPLHSSGVCLGNSLINFHRKKTAQKRPRCVPPTWAWTKIVRGQRSVTKALIP